MGIAELLTVHAEPLPDDRTLVGVTADVFDQRVVALERRRIVVPHTAASAVVFEMFPFRGKAIEVDCSTFLAALSDIADIGPGWEFADRRRFRQDAAAATLVFEILRIRRAAEIDDRALFWWGHKLHVWLAKEIVTEVVDQAPTATVLRVEHLAHAPEQILKTDGRIVLTTREVPDFVIGRAHVRDVVLVVNVVDIVDVIDVVDVVDHPPTVRVWRRTERVALSIAIPIELVAEVAAVHVPALSGLFFRPGFTGLFGV